MPIYEYRCDSCGNLLEALQKIGDAHLLDCPECGESALRRLMSAPSFRLKGSGWYETDFKSDKEHKRNLAEGAEPKSSDGEKPAKTDDSKGAGDKSADTKPEASTKKPKDPPSAKTNPKSDKGSSSAAL